MEIYKIYKKIVGWPIILVSCLIINITIYLTWTFTDQILWVIRGVIVGIDVLIILFVLMNEKTRRKNQAQKRAVAFRELRKKIT
ncbi:hypothetical protein A2Z33_00410 [Candidatus Gottesmanbacteria bacterium RBG_16_52_11]|uniref:Uncharacterized protein n=1 Tax=Candidatus Gottesmanbacteria bacterium RBG_16_52_11 TaxID=1798374 RepID=A0A1F5YNN0_9BACT|nr:MAG: hypothetical protein A2Z33_00410 [Candidatus Gottesmanbacteria bacterium RBG_16_52_11]